MRIRRRRNRPQATPDDQATPSDPSPLDERPSAEQPTPDDQPTAEVESAPPDAAAAEVEAPTRKRNRIWPVVTVVTVGVAFSLGLAAFRQETVKRDQELAAETVAGYSSDIGANTVDRLEGELARLDSYLGGLAALVSTNADLTAQQFADAAVESGPPHVADIAAASGGEVAVVVPVTEEARAEFEAEMQSVGHDDFAVAGARTADDYLVVTHTLDRAGPAGQDLGTVPEVRATLETAAETGETLITSELATVPGLDDQPGYLVARPIESGSDGWMVAVLPLDAAAGVPIAAPLAGGGQQATLRLFDEAGTAVGGSTGTSIDESPEAGDTGADDGSGDIETLSIDVYGQRWTLEVESLPTLIRTAGNNEPLLLMMVGLVLTIVMATLVMLVNGSRSKALALADTTQRALAETDAVLDERKSFAAAQSFMRQNVQEAFTNLGRRSQNLLGRQLEIIDELEREEAEPDKLSQLFDLDNLATRMRRHAEGLLVVAGERSPRTWARPVPVRDVARGAMSEVEEYRRIQIASMEDALVQGNAAADVAHLLAELMENACRFSAPSDAVGVYGQQHGDGYLITVVDQGIGMSGLAMAQINEVLARPDGSDQVPAASLGLVVVGRLATEYAIRVLLVEGPGGGTAAQVILPESLLAPADEVASLGLDAYLDQPAPTDTAALWAAEDRGPGQPEAATEEVGEAIPPGSGGPPGVFKDGAQRVRPRESKLPSADSAPPGAPDRDPASVGDRRSRYRDALIRGRGGHTGLPAPRSRPEEAR